MLSFRQLLTICIALYALNATSQRGQIITAASTSVMDPNGDGYVSLDTDGFSNDGYYLDEFEFTMFALPIFGDGDALNDTQAGPNCGSTDLTVDSEGQAAYAVLDGNNNLIFRLRLAAENPAVKAYTVLIDTDGAIGSSDDNFNTSNLGFEIDITLIKSNSKGILVYDIDGATGCPTEVLQYDLSSNFQLSIADEVSCGDEDYFYDFFVPFGDLTTEFGITVNSELQFAVLTNISATCALGGSVSDIGGVNDDDYAGCIECAFEDLASNQCPVPFSELQDGGGGFASGSTPEPELETPLKEGDNVISGKAAPEADVYIDVYDINDALVESDTSQVDSDSLWSVTLTLPLSQGDSVVAVAEIPGNCDSQASGSQVSFAVVVLNTKPTIGGTAIALAYTENDGAVPVDPGVTASDNEDLDFVYATIQISSGYESTEDALTFTNQLGLTGSYDAGTATMTITGDATVDDYNTALQSVAYSNSSEDPVESTRTLTFIINDGTEDSDPFLRDIIVSAENDAPVIAGTSGSTEYPASPPLNVNSTMSITDADDAQLTAATIQVVLSLDSSFVDGDELLFTDQLGITGSYNSTTGVLSLSGTADLADYATALNSIDYEYNPPGTADYDSRRVLFWVSDGTNSSSHFQHFITFADDVNLPPDVVDENGDPIVDGIDVTTNEDSTVEVCITVSDPDGDLVTIDNISTPSNGSISITGDLCFEYTPDDDFNGTETVTVTVCDAVGNCDATPVDITITIDEVNDPPVITPSTESADEKTTTQLCIDPSDITDVEGDTHEFTSGTSANGGTVADGTADDLCFDYTPPDDFIGTDQVEVTICDSIDPTVCATTTIDVEVIDVNDSPIIYVKGIDSETMTVETFEDSVKVFCFSVVDEDGDNVSTKSIVNVSGNGTLVADATEFCYEYTPVADENGIPSVWTITIEDDGTGNLTDMVTVTLNIEAVNDYPTLSTITDPTAIDEDAAEQTINLSGISAGGGESQTLTVAATSNNTALIPHPTVTYASADATGSLAYTPVADQSGTAVITVTVDDGVDSLNIVTRTFTVEVNAINDKPVITAQSTLSTDEETDLTIGLGDLTVTDPDNTYPDDFTLTVNTGTNYTVAGNTITPADDFNGTLTVPVTVNDGTIDADPFNLSITVNAINDVPTLADIADPAAIDEDAGEQTVSLSGITPGGGESQTLAVTATSDNTALIPNPTVTYSSPNATGSLAYTPVSDQSGTATITVTVNDDQASNNTVFKTFTVTVNAINDKPVITAQSALSTDEETDLTIGLGDLTVTDPDNTYPDDFTLNVNTGTNYTVAGNTITPDDDFNGTLTVPVTVNDGTIDADPFNLSVTVNAINDKPVITAQSALSTDEETDLTIVLGDLNVTDPDNTYPDDFTLNVNTGTNYTVAGNTITPADDFSGTLTVPVTVNDGTIDADPFNLSVTVNAINDKPVITAQSALSTDEETDLTIGLGDLTVTDPDNTYPDDFTLNVNTGTNYTVAGNTITPADDFSGTLTVPVTVNDGTIDADPFNLSVTVNAINDKPVITAQSALSTDEETDLTIGLGDLTVTDPDNTYPDDFTLNVNTGTNYTVTGNTITPDGDFNGTLTVPVTVNDGTIDADPFNLSVTVNAINDKPVITAQSALSTDEETDLTIGLGDLTVTDPDNTYPDDFTLNVNTGTNYTVAGNTITPDDDFNGTLTVPVTVNDGTIDADPFDLSITVNAINDVPTLADISDPAAIDEDAGEQTVSLSGITPGGGESQTLTVTATSDNTALIPNPTVTYSSPNATGSLAYTPVSDQSGTATITVTVDDGETSNNTVSKTFTVTVDPVNDVPIVDELTLQVLEKETTTLCVTVSDIEGDTHIFKSGTSSTSATIANGTADDMCFEYTPADDFLGTDQIEVTICDANDPSICATGTINVEVLDVNDPPIFIENGIEVNSITIDAMEDTPLDICLEYTDPEGNNVSTTGITNLSGGGLLTEGTTSLCYTFEPKENVYGAVLWQVDVQDDGTPPAAATVFININVANINDAPETRPDTLMVMRKESKSINVLLNDYDLDGDELQLRTTLEKQPMGGVATISQDGTITYVSDANFRGIDSLIYIVEDLGSPSLTAFGKMIIRIDDNPFTIYQTVSPNGDGMNDYWHIEGIDFYPDNTVTLFDRYNNLVFEINGYNNEDKVWIGNSNTGSNNTLPEGTYFYRISAGEAGTFGGFVVLRGTEN
ncbi:tandem-95 repeat protein [Ekhidna sp.]|uniref:tandem-95 repeat protein n=1 Tax=Ekhidna sp. TaxID=2608089 RepID=UPI003CCBF351